MRFSKWMAVPLAVIVVPVTMALVFHGNSVENKNIDWGSIPASGHPDEGEAILSDCAKTSCVATKAADLAAQAEKVKVAQAPVEEQAVSYSPPVQTLRSTTPAPQPVSPAPGPTYCIPCGLPGYPAH